MNQVHKRIRILMYTFCFVLITTNFIPYTIIDPQLVPYDKEFIETVSSICPWYKYNHFIQKAIYFQNLPSNKLAYSLSNGRTRMRIVVDSNYWVRANDDMKYATMFHELGHSILDLDHSSDPTNWIFAYEFNISKEEVKKQLIYLLKERCR